MLIWKAATCRRFPFHADRDRRRSAFFQFSHLPEERDATVDYIDYWNKGKVFPVGTQVALIEKAFLQSRQSEILHN
jgi:hypothetical protein